MEFLKQEKAVAELKQRIPDIIAVSPIFEDDIYIFLWLKERKFNPEKTEKLVRAAWEYRQKKQLDGDLSRGIEPEILTKFKVTILPGTTDGYPPLAYIPAGYMDVMGALSKYGHSTIALYFAEVILHLEQQLVDYCKASNHTLQDEISGRQSLNRNVIIVDVEGFRSLGGMYLEALKVVMEQGSLISTYCPGIRGHLFFINLNKVFSAFFTAIKPVLTLSPFKIEAYGKEERSWRAKLVGDVISEENLNRLLSGNEFQPIQI